jgi:hypothetical protein
MQKSKDLSQLALHLITNAIAWFWNQVHAQPTKIEIENLNNILYNIRKIKTKS